MKRRFVLIAALLGLACDGKPERAPPRTELIVFAAASLRESFEAAAKAFERTHPEAHVTLSFAGSQALRAQIEHGAPADVFASADERHMHALAQAKLVGAPRVFASNDLVVVVAKAKAATLRAVTDLPHAERVVIGAPEVPVGAYTERFLAKAEQKFGGDFRKQVEAHVVSREPDVRQVLAKVKLGDADAGVVYRTDALAAAAAVEVVAIPSELDVVAEYPVAVTAAAHAPELGRAFVESLTAPEGAALLKAYGLTPVGEKSATP